MSLQLKAIIIILSLIIIYIYIYESRNKNTNGKQTNLKNEARQRIKNCINENIGIQIQRFKNKNNTKNYNNITNYHTFNPQKYDNLQHYVFQHNHTNTSPKYLNNTKVEESNNTKNYSDYEAMWEIAIDKWTRNWNFYRKRLT